MEFEHRNDTDEEQYAVLDVNIKRAELSRSTNSIYKMSPYWVIHQVGSEGGEVKTNKWAKGNK